MTVSTSNSGTVTPVGTYPLKISGTSNGRTHTTSATLVVTDGIGPTVSAPTSRLFGLVTLGSSTMPVRTSWSASDPSGIASYALHGQVDGSWSPVSLTSATSTSVVQSLPFGSTYRYAAKATDGKANTSGWAYGSSFRPYLLQESGTGLAYSGTWSGVADAAASGGGLKYATANGASAGYAFNGSSVAWVSYRGPTRGSADVYVDGVKKATVNLYAAANSARQIVFAANWTWNGSHTIKIVCLGTAGHARVDVDAFVRLTLT
jgi:hypothetical protein